MENNNYRIADNKGRNLFLKIFANNIKKYKEMDQYCHHDLDITGLTATASIEIKLSPNDNYFVETFSGQTFFNQSKIEHFKKIYENDPERKLLLVRIWIDGISLFDISERIKQNSNQLNSFDDKLGTNTVNNFNEIKQTFKTAHLSICKDYNDKMYHYNHNKGYLSLKSINYN